MAQKRIASDVMLLFILCDRSCICVNMFHAYDFVCNSFSRAESREKDREREYKKLIFPEQCYLLFKW